MPKIDALIIHPTSLRAVYQKLSSEAAIEPPIWAAMITKFLLTQGYSAEIIDCEAEELSFEDTVKRIAVVDPKLIVIVVYGQQPSASTQNMYGAGLLCKAIKQVNPERKILLVGGHVSALPARTLQEEDVDFVCQGEGPETIVGLLESDLKNPISLEKINGLWFRYQGRPYCKNLSSMIPQEQLAALLPGMAFELLPMDKYRAHNWHCFSNINQRMPYASLYTSLGCPFNCSFCCINAPFGKSAFRYWQPEFIIKQFDLLANKYKVKNIKIADEMFVFKEDHFLKLCDLIIERKYDFNIWAYARVDTVKPQYLKKLKRAGVNWLALGIESKSKHVRAGVTKAHFKEEDIFTIVKMIQNEGIFVHGNYIFGLPEDSLETMQQTLDLAIELNCEMSNFYSAMAYPGSQLYKIAVENNWQLPDSWLGFSQHSYETLPLATKYVSAGEVLRFRDAAWHKYYTGSLYLDMINKRFGKETHDYMVKLTKYKLKRKFKQEAGI